MLEQGGSLGSAFRLYWSVPASMVSTAVQLSPGQLTPSVEAGSKPAPQPAAGLFAAICFMASVTGTVRCSPPSRRSEAHFPSCDPLCRY